MNNKTKTAAYADYYLARFRNKRDHLKTLLDEAEARLAIAERQYAAGQMVTGTEDGIFDSLRRILK